MSGIKIARLGVMLIFAALAIGYVLQGLPPQAAQGAAAPTAGPETATTTTASSQNPEAEASGGHEQQFDYWSMLFVFMLSTFIGIGVIRRVSRLLHTPLMSLTNAISAIAVVGAIIVTGSEHPIQIRILGAIALFASMTNIVSGFLITDRMLKMFKGEGGKR
jgi:H+-translocating NAD(P) transhydrogenase subunit alpha